MGNVKYGPAQYPGQGPVASGAGRKVKGLTLGQSNNRVTVKTRPAPPCNEHYLLLIRVHIETLLGLAHLTPETNHRWLVPCRTTLPRFNKIH